jgi:hypothetical protein
VYAAVLDPDALLISEDPNALSRHRFVTSSDARGREVFFPTILQRTEKRSPSRLAGGFMTLEETAAGLSVHKVRTLAAPVGPRSQKLPRAASAPASQSAEAVFRVNGQLVEVLATVTDSRGRYADDLRPSQFTVSDSGKPVPIVSFENRATPVSVALLFDSTGSMQNALPPLKSAALRLVKEMRPVDALAVYTFNSTVSELQPFTTD